MEGGESRVTRVVLKPGESQERLLKRFRKKVAKDGTLREVKRKRFFISNSEERRMALRKARRRERRRLWRQRRNGRRS
jgi:small subunit ribosomal protein S21